MAVAKLVRGSVVAAAVAAYACSVYDESLLLPGDAGGGGGSGGSTASCSFGDCWWTKVTPEGCRSALRPTQADAPRGTPANEEPAIYMAIDRLWLGESHPPGVPTEVQPWETMGMDLDGLCSDPASCLAAPEGQYGCKGVLPQTDGIACRDNVFGELEPIAAAEPNLGKPFGINENTFNCMIHRGNTSVLARLTGYNGEPNDEKVRVDFYMSPGIDRPDPTVSCCNLDGSTDWQGMAPWLAAPAFPWRVDEADLEGRPVAPGTLPDSRWNDPSAYVRDGYVVVKLLDGTVIKFIGDNAQYPGFALRILGGTISLKIERKQGTWIGTDGVIAGRLLREDLLAAFTDIGFCEAAIGASWSTLIGYLESSMDVLGSGENVQGADCDAMSMAIGFTMREAYPGTPVPVAPTVSCPTPPTKCGQTWDPPDAGSDAGDAAATD